MTQSAKDKAVELVEYFQAILESPLTKGMFWKEAKQCAIIAVDEIEKALGKADTAYDLLPSIEYWQQVRSEIENM